MLNNANEALTFVERLVQAPLPVIMAFIIVLLGYALYRREKAYISVNFTFEVFRYVCFFIFYLINMKNIEKILNLAKNRIKYFTENKTGWYTGHEVYLKALTKELGEATKEIKENNSVYLEDELGDVLWDYLLLLSGLEEEGLIKREKVFERCYKKFSERIDYVTDKDEYEAWDEIKKIQKERRKEEHDDLYNK